MTWDVWAGLALAALIAMLIVAGLWAVRRKRSDDAPSEAAQEHIDALDFDKED